MALTLLTGRARPRTRALSGASRDRRYRREGAQLLLIWLALVALGAQDGPWSLVDVGVVGVLLGSAAWRR